MPQGPMLLWGDPGTPPAPPANVVIQTAAPRLEVLVFFTTVPTDITRWVRRLSINRGRNRERETMSPGRVEIDLWNFDGRFDPDNQLSPYAPNIRPNKVVEIRANTDATTTAFTIGSSSIGGGDAFGGGGENVDALFVGRLEGGTLEYAEGGLQPTVTWRAIDASKRLNRDRSTSGFGVAGDLTGERVNAVLDGASPTWPTSERDIAPGTRTVQAATGDRGRYDYMVELAASEFGAFFIGKDGRAIFRDATWEPSPAATVLGSDVGEYVFSSIEVTDDETEIWNAVTVTADGLTDQFAEDLASQAELGRSDLPVSTLLDNVGDMTDVAATLIEAYSQPRRRISSLSVDRVATDWHFFLSKELQDRVTVRHRPIYGGEFEQESVIQGIQIDVNGSQDWRTTWNLTPPLSVVSNPNLLTEDQSGFENGVIDNGWVVSFTETPPGNGIYIVGVAGGPGTSIALVGQYVMELRTYGIAQIQGAVITNPYTTVPVVVGERYRVSAWVRSFWASIWGIAAIRFYDFGGAEITQIQGFISGFGTTEWFNVTAEAEAPGGAAYAAAEVIIVENDTDGHPAYIDAVELRHIGA